MKDEVIMNLVGGCYLASLTLHILWRCLKK